MLLPSECYTVQTGTSRLVMYSDCCSQPFCFKSQDLESWQLLLDLMALFDFKVTFPANPCGFLLVL